MNEDFNYELCLYMFDFAISVFVSHDIFSLNSNIFLYQLNNLDIIVNEPGLKRVA